MKTKAENLQIELEKIGQKIRDTNDVQELAELAKQAKEIQDLLKEDSTQNVEKNSDDKKTSILLFSKKTELQKAIQLINKLNDFFSLIGSEISIKKTTDNEIEIKGNSANIEVLYEQLKIYTIKFRITGQHIDEQIEKFFLGNPGEQEKERKIFKEYVDIGTVAYHFLLNELKDILIKFSTIGKFDRTNVVIDEEEKTLRSGKHEIIFGFTTTSNNENPNYIQYFIQLQNINYDQILTVSLDRIKAFLMSLGFGNIEEKTDEFVTALYIPVDSLFEEIAGEEGLAFCLEFNKDIKRGFDYLKFRLVKRNKINKENLKRSNRIASSYDPLELLASTVDKNVVFSKNILALSTIYGFAFILYIKSIIDRNNKD